MVDSPRSRSWDDRDQRDWRDPRDERSSRPAPDDWDGPPRRGYRRSEPGLEQRLDQWMSAGRQLVDGVAGARPGSRPSARGTGAAAGPRLRPGDLGRWVENKIDWLLEDDDGWREPWQEARAPRRTESRHPRADGLQSSAQARAETPASSSTAAPSSRRRPLEAISRRGTPLLAPQPPAPSDQDWPDDASFSVSRWRRETDAPQPVREPAAPNDAPAASPQARAVPRSSRRRLD